MNREIINLLTSIGNAQQKNPFDQHIWDLQERALHSYLDRLSVPSKAYEALITFLPTFRIREIEETFNLLDQSWWLKILVMTYLMDVQLLKSKANIPVEKAARLFGAPDPSGLLCEGQVYCVIQVIKFKYFNFVI